MSLRLWSSSPPIMEPGSAAKLSAPPAASANRETKFKNNSQIETLMIATQEIEILKSGTPPAAAKIKRGLNARVLGWTFTVLTVLFLADMFPRWRADAALTTSVRDQRPTVNVI